jgi:hypothetical protein
MPAIAHLAPRFLEDGGGGGISATAIVLLIILGLIPAVAVLWIAIWLMFFYPQDRNCCCCVRKKKKKNKDQQPTLPNVSPDTSHESLYNEKNISAIPKRPWASHERTESGSSNGSGKIVKQHRHNASDGRMSVLSRSSERTVQIAHEPKPFV